MSGRFLLRRSALAREQAQRTAQVSEERIANLVALTTTLADRMEARPSAGLDRDRDRRERVQVLRRAAEAGTRTLDARARLAESEGGDGQRGAAR